MSPTNPLKLPRSKPRSNASLAISPPFTSRQSGRKRKPRQIPDSAPNFKIAPASVGGAHQSWSNTEEVALLEAAARFRARTGSAPRTPDMEDFFESVKTSLGSGMDQVRVFYKLKRLKSKFFQTDGPLSGGPHERLLYKLSAEVWGSESSAKIGRELARETNSGERVEVENGSVSCTFVAEELRKYWRENGRVTSEVLLEEGLRSMDPTRAMKLEMKWREQVESDMRLKMKQHEMFKEVYSLLAQTVKSMEQ